jgi:hypothetical protein
MRKNAMKRMFFYLFALSVIVGCGNTLTGYDFETTASYSAIKSDFKVNLHVIGHVSAGEDLGTGDLKGIIIFTKTADTIYFESHSITLTLLKYEGNPQEIIDSTNFAKTLIALFESTGHKDYDRNEIEEMEKIIKAATYGPKGTYLEGQTKLIKVENVKFDRE